MPTTIRPNRKVTIARPFIWCHLLSREVDGVILEAGRGGNVNVRRSLRGGPAALRSRFGSSAGGGFDHHAREAVLLRQAVGLGVAVAGTREGAIGLEEVRVPVPMAGGVGVRGRDAHPSQLGVLLEHARERVA